mgnify:CR=1 FL=1|tara:strand:+ start:3279 stop:3887 length:609 start_codon:yes stop_codon:yes gene_type:complete
MNPKEKLQEILGEFIYTELDINSGDKILYFLFEGLCNNLQEIVLEDYEEKESENSLFFRLEEEEIRFGCFFYLPIEKPSLKKYLSHSFNDWFFSVEDNFTEEYLKNEKNAILVDTENIECNFPDEGCDTYGSIYKFKDDEYKLFDNDYENHKYEYGDENLTGGYTTNGLVKVVYINCESSKKFEIIDLGFDFEKRIEELKLI